MFVRSLIISAIILTVVPTSTAHPPLVFRGADGQCAPSPEICGDGIDQDCDGKDALCPGNDKDFDGFPDHADCDDTDRWVYPGISVACDVNGAAGTKTCQNNGTYTACTTTPLCEAKGSGRCYYISKLTGSDSNPGTFQQPFKSYLPIVSRYGPPPSGTFALKPGDVVYFMSGKYDDWYTYYQDHRRGLFLRGVSGTPDAPIRIQVYPGAKVVFSNDLQITAFVGWNISHFIFEGIELSNIKEQGVWLEGGSNIEIRNMWIHDLDGVDNNNHSGIKLTDVRDVYIHHNLVHDNYDRQNHDTGGNKTENSRNMVFFSGGNIRVSYNVVFNTPPVTASIGGACVGYKHHQTLEGGRFEVDNNIFRNCSFYAVGSGTSNSRIHHNLVIDSGPMATRDFGGRTHNDKVFIEFNTFVNGLALSHNPSSTYFPIGTLTYKNNIMVDQPVGYHQERGVVTVSTYAPDSQYIEMVQGGLMSYSNNCYFNPSHSIRFSLFASKTGGRTLGGIYDLNGWRSFGYDTNSFETNPNFTSHFVPQNPNCIDAGFWAGR